MKKALKPHRQDSDRTKQDIQRLLRGRQLTPFVTRTELCNKHQISQSKWLLNIRSDQSNWNPEEDWSYRLEEAPIILPEETSRASKKLKNGKAHREGHQISPDYGIRKHHTNHKTLQEEEISLSGTSLKSFPYSRQGTK